MKYLAYIMLFVLVLSGLGCRRHEMVVPQSDADKLNEALNLKGVLMKGALPPATTGPGQALNIDYYPAQIEVAAGVTVFVPFSTNDNEKVKEFYIQVQGATKYWKVPAPVDTSVDNLNIEMQIPSFAQKGGFNIVTLVSGKSGAISTAVTTNAIIATPLSCNSEFEGSVGITVKHLDLGNTKGWVTLWYDTYTIPDRIDIRYNKKWVNSTAGNNIANTYYPDCGRYPADGFVSYTGSLKFFFDPSISKLVDVYITGCDNATLWEINVGCPDSNFYAGLPDCPCNYTDAQAKDGQQELDGVWNDCGSANEDYHYGAKYEVRWLPNIPGNAGQQCTYDASRNLITGGIAAGSPDKSSPRNCGFWSWLLNPTAAGPSDYLKHKEKDMDTWKTLPCEQYLREWKANNALGCSRNSVTDISGQQISTLVKMMTCKEVTDLFKAVYESDKATYSIVNLFKYGYSMSWAQVRTDLMKVKDSYSSIVNPSKVEALEKALANIP